MGLTEDDYHSLSLTRIQFHSPTGYTTHWPCLDHDSLTLKQLPSHQGMAQQQPEWSRPHNFFCMVQEEQLSAQNTSLRHPWNHVKQFATTTIHHDILRPIREKLSQNRQHWTSNSHRRELEENPLMVDPVKSSTKVDLNYSSLLPRLQSTL